MIEVNNLTPYSVSDSFIKKIGDKVLNEEGKERSYISIALLGKNKIRELNRMYLGRDSFTDVLSFSQDQEEFSPQPSGDLGEVIVCPEIVESNAEEMDSDFQKELARVVIHGILHLLGYDHTDSSSQAKEMRQKEERYLESTLSP